MTGKDVSTRKENKRIQASKRRQRRAVNKIESIALDSLEHLKKRLNSDAPDEIKDQIALKMAPLYAAALMPQHIIHSGDSNNPIDVRDSTPWLDIARKAIETNKAALDKDVVDEQ